jgi:transposase InsO family protein
MPWKESCRVHERMLFVSRVEQGERMTDLCREFGMSRKTGYKILARYQEKSVVGLYDEKRTPQHIPHRTPPEVVERLLKLRKRHPSWGPRKLRAWLVDHEGPRWPSTTTIGELLKKNGLIAARQRHRGPETLPMTLSTPALPNDLWCIDYKGQFRLGNGKYCCPLTVTDAASRFLLVCEGMDRVDGERVWEELLGAFRRYGLPKAIRSDNGSPFASRGVCGLSRLSARWIELGIAHERIEPGKPQQNGRHERMHRTLKAETTRPAASSMLAQQERFDGFRELFNEQRPHEALEMSPPARHYTASSRPYASPPPVRYPLHDDVKRVAASGHLRIGGRRGTNVFLSSALAGHRVGLRELDDGRWLVSFVDLHLGLIEPGKSTLLPIENLPQVLKMRSA